MPRSGHLRASTPPLTCSTGISWHGCQARATSCSPVRKHPAPAIGIYQFFESNGSDVLKIDPSVLPSASV